MKKTKVKLIGEDGNIFNLLGIATKALKKDGKAEQAKELTNKIFSAGSYEEALSLISEYCEIN